MDKIAEYLSHAENRAWLIKMIPRWLSVYFVIVCTALLTDIALR